MFHKTGVRRVVGLLATFATAIGLAGCAGGGESASGKPKIFVAMAHSGTNWPTEAANIAMAIATSPEVAEKYETRKVISGSDVQKQISDYQSMIAEGAKLIVSFPISPTALDPVIKQGCDRGVVFVMFDSAVNAPCAWNVEYLTAPTAAEPDKPFFGAQSAQALVDLLKGEGKIFMNRGIAGVSTDNVNSDAAKAVFSKYPGIQVVAEYYGKWDASVAQQETSKALAAHPDVDGVWSQDGDAGVVKALKAAGKTIPVTGENSNYFRAAIGQGWPGISAGSPPAQAGVAMKIGLKILAEGPESVDRNIEMPMPWVTNETAKECPGSVIEDGCNYFKSVDDAFMTEVFEPTLLPEITLDSAKTGKPVEKLTPLPDMTKYIQPPQRRIYSRGSCDEGWKPGPVMTGQTPAGLPGCVKE